MLPDADKEENTACFSITFNDLDDYADILKAYRKKHRLTQEHLAEIMGVKHVTLRSWEQRTAKPPYNIWRCYKNLFVVNRSLTDHNI